MDENKDELQNADVTPEQEETPAVDMQPEIAEEVAEEIVAEETVDVAAEGQELVVAPSQEIVTEEKPAVTPEVAQPPKKKKTGLIIGIVAAAIVIGGAAFALLGGGDSGPKKIVKAAIANSYEQSEALAQRMEEEIPFLKKSAELRDKTTHTDFKFTLNKLDGVEGSEAVNMLFSGANLQGSAEMTPDAETISFNGALYLFGREFISATLYQSPDAIAFGLPSISKNIVGIDLNTYEKDMETSPLKDAGLEVDELMDSIDEMKSSMKASAVSDDAVEEMGKKIEKMTEDLLDKASYELGETADGVTEYIVTIAPKDVRNYFVSLMEYLFLDSPFRPIYEAEYSTSMMGYDSIPDYEGDMKQVIKAVRENMPDLEVEIVYEIKDEKEIVGYVMNVTTPNAKEDDSVKLEKFAFVGENYTDGGTIYGEFSLNIDGEYLDMVLTCDAAYENKVYAIGAVLGIMVDDETMDMSVDYEIDGNESEDNIYFEMGLGIENEDLLNIYCQGDAYVDGEQVIYNLKQLRGYLNDGEEEMELDFSLMLKNYAIEKVAEIPFTNLFTMTEQELNDLVMEYNNGFNQLVSGFGL